jgi:M6 family metalloprotease-like protein
MPPSFGALRIAMLFVDFADAPGSASPDALVNDYAPAVARWYRSASNERLQLVIEPVRRWLRLPRLLSEYEAAHFSGAIEDVLAVADPQHDFSRVDALYVLTSQPSGAFAATVIDHVPRRVDGRDIRAWIWFAAGGSGRARPEVLIHETGHLLGLPDLYDVGRRGGRHRWDVMAGSGGAGMLAWHRWKLGWLEEREVVCLTSRQRRLVELSPLTSAGTGTKAIVYRTRRAAVVVEVRARTGVDASLCRAGVLVYRVDFVRGAPATLGRLGVPIDVWPARRGDSARCGDDWRAPYGVGRGDVRRGVPFGLRLQVLAQVRGGGYRVRVEVPRR